MTTEALVRVGLQLMRSDGQGAGKNLDAATGGRNAQSDFLRESIPVAWLDLTESIDAADLHGHLGGQARIDRGRQQVVERCQHGRATREEQREILGMRIVIPI